MKRQEITNIGEHVKKREPSYTVGRKIPFEIIEDSSKKKKRIELSYYSAILLLGIYLKNTKILI